YKAKLKGIRVIYVDPAQTSSLCPICGERLSPNGHRIMKCKNCGFSADRDIIGSWNIRLTALKMWGSRTPESQSMKPGEGRLSVTSVTANQNGWKIWILRLLYF
ncbi:MAG TPA: transposase, partial [Euryarchaeota archaeon]|nr:transposase [Euryarchaeota archaeon]